MGSRLVWYGDQCAKLASKEAGKRVKKATFYLRDYIRAKLSTPCPPHSAPGEYPHRESGNLRRGIEAEYDPDVNAGRVGTNVEYGKWLEGGTKNMDARPWLAPSVSACWGHLRAILRGEA